MIPHKHILPLTLAPLLLAGCLSGGDSSSPAPGNTETTEKTPPKSPPEIPDVDDEVAETVYSATLRRTEFGIPHIEADDFESMGYAYGYVQAEDNLCLLAEDTLTIRGLRSRYLGADGTYRIPSNGAQTTNLNADFFWKATATDKAIAPLKANSDPEVIEASAGYVAGFNRYLSEIKSGQHSGRHEACRDEEWLFELEESDMYRRYFRLAVLASSSVFVDGIATASPPKQDGTDSPQPGEGDLTAEHLERLPKRVARAIENNLAPLSNLPDQPGNTELDAPDDTQPLASTERDRTETLLSALQKDEIELGFPFDRELPIGSNMYGLSAEASANGESMLFGNPHFPWEKTERLYLAHLKVGDSTEIMGASLYGLPAVLIGFNEHFAWSHTVSTAYRFTFYELTLNPSDPTQYWYDNQFVDMEARDINIDVLEDDGSVSTHTRTLYSSHYGPMLTFEAAGVPVLNWSSAKAYTLRDANAENDRLLNQFFRWNQAKSFEEFVELHSSVLGVPWVNTVATGPGKPAYYGDVTVVPNVTDVQAQSPACASSLTPVFAQLAPGLPILNGSNPECAWGNDDDAPARADGIFGPKNLPKLERNDWVHNCNDSYWLTNPKEPLTGFAGIIGDENTPRTLRTRKCILQVKNQLESNELFDLAGLQSVVLDSSLLSEELAREDVLNAYCDSETLLASNGEQVNITQACEALRAWDGTHNLNSGGGHTWREFWRTVASISDSSPDKWLVPFDATGQLDGPVNTPRVLNVANPRIEMAFADAVKAIENAGIPFDASIREIQISGIHEGENIPVFGGEGFEGAFTIAISRPNDLSDGKYDVNYGNSYIQTVTWNDDGTPKAEGFVTYSQSTDPASPYYRDMTEAYSRKQWIRFPFTEEEIALNELPVQYQFEELAKD
ncbi:penicillin acylase family protein [Marinobacter sediminum]|uniref:penicillin acylase family protein n=1 Tax=Marinobacter sediminum TaxID=256323 RepID=UPI00193A0A07|nr:penicillin acylase family protein [Marinobacter sediminum]